MRNLEIDSVESALGQLVLVSDGTALCALDFSEFEDRIMARLTKRVGSFKLIRKNNPQGCSDALRAYFQQNFEALQTIPINPGGTPFQQQVWATLRTIPPGTTLTYAELAYRVGNPTAYRAVGTANGQNPIAIVVPCHRVIGANGQLTGYASGLDRKQWLLQHENAIASVPPQQMQLLPD